MDTIPHSAAAKLISLFSETGTYYYTEFLFLSLSGSIFSKSVKNNMWDISKNSSSLDELFASLLINLNAM